MNTPLVCWRCGNAIDYDGTRRTETCGGCHADLHVCRLCTLFDPNRFAGCREERAEPPTDKERANFCDWFQPRRGAFQAPSEPDAAKTALEALFGGSSEISAAAPDAARRALEDLFKKD